MIKNFRKKTTQFHRDYAKQIIWWPAGVLDGIKVDRRVKDIMVKFGCEENFSEERTWAIRDERTFWKRQ